MIRVRIGADEHQLAWEEWEERVRAGRIPEDALVQFEAVTRGEWVPAGQLEMYRSLRNEAAIAWQGNFLAGPPPVLTALLVGVQIRVWWFARIPRIRGELVDRFTNWTGPALENGEVWRPLTMGFLHTDLFHLVLNMLWLAYTGWNLERALGRKNLFTIYIAAVLGGSLLSMFGSPETPSLGASGGVFGLVAASTVFGLVRPELLPQRGRRLFGMAMLPYLVLMFWSGLMNEDTDNWSHAGGLITGLFLGFVLSPPPMQRRPGANARWQTGVAVWVVVTLGGLYALGPRMMPLVDHHVATQQARDRRAPVEIPDTYQALRYEVPAGWRPDAEPGGLRGFSSRGGDRVFAVREREGDELVTPEAVGARWLEDLQSRWPNARVSELEPHVIAGHPGLYRRVVIDPEGTPRGIEWWGTTRGVRQLEVVWSVDLAKASRLDPLRARLLDRVQWEEPDDLLKARNDVAYTPNSPRARTELAMALARDGQTDEALALHAALREESPADPDRWVDTLRTAALGGVPMQVQEQLWADALAAAPTPRVVVEVAGALEDAGRLEEAAGLLDIAWSARPGDRLIKRARRGLDLSVVVSAEGMPWDDFRVPATAAVRDRAEVARRLTRPVDLATAAREGLVRTRERAQAIEVACDALANADADAAWPPLLWLMDGALPEPDSDAPVALLDDLGRGASWMPEDLVACLPPLAPASMDPNTAPRR